MEARKIESILTSISNHLKSDNYHSIPIQGILSSVKKYDNRTYFEIKDSTGFLSGIYFAGGQMVESLTNGVTIFAVGDVSTYRSRIQFKMNYFQIIKQEYDIVRESYQKLTDKNLIREKNLPNKICHKLGIVASAESAALQDFFSKCGERKLDSIKFIVYPTTVQGENAPAQIRKSIRKAVSEGEVDAMIIIRGGGSQQDLSCFNDYKLARQILASPIPVITGIGHAVDYTLADAVADVHQITPTAVAEFINDLVSPSEAIIQGSIDLLEREKEWLIETAKEIANVEKSLQEKIIEIIEKNTKLVVKEQNTVIETFNQWKKTWANYEESNLLAIANDTLRRELVQLLDYKAQILEMEHPILLNRENAMVKHASNLEVGEKYTLIMPGGVALVKIINVDHLS